jgi:hypothetical protein
LLPAIFLLILPNQINQYAYFRILRLLHLGSGIVITLYPERNCATAAGNLAFACAAHPYCPKKPKRTSCVSGLDRWVVSVAAFSLRPLFLSVPEQFA